MEKRLTNKYLCTGEDGAPYTVFEYVEVNDGATWGGQAEEEGDKELELGNGSAVNKISDSEFQVVSTGVKLKLNG